MPLTVRQAARVKGCSRQAIYAAIFRGELNSTPSTQRLRRGPLKLTMVAVDDRFHAWEPKREKR